MSSLEVAIKDKSATSVKSLYYFKRLVQIIGSSQVANIATIVALIWAVNSFSSTNALQRDLVRSQTEIEMQVAANEAWSSYVEWSFANPRFSAGKFSEDDFADVKSQKYVWYIERLLSASEQVLNAYPSDPQWIDAFVVEFQMHEQYFVSDYFLARNVKSGVSSMSFFCSYDRPVRATILRAYSGSPTTRVAMERAKSECDEDLRLRGKPNA